MYILNQEVFHTEHSLLTSVWHKALMSYLRFNVDLLGCLLIEPFHVNLAVEVSDVADDGVIFHLLKVPVREKKHPSTPEVIHIQYLHYPDFIRFHF